MPDDLCPRLALHCRTVADVVAAVGYVRAGRERFAVRGGGHCFAGRSSTDGVLIDLSGLDDITVADDGVARIGAGARLGPIYSALHDHGRTLPAGCGATVGIAGLTLGGGIGLLGRRHGLTCDRLIGAQVVLADGTVVDCDSQHEADLFWALRGSGGAQFGVVTALRLDTVAEPPAVPIRLAWTGADLGRLIAAWQAWAPDAPDEITLNLTLAAQPGAPVRATLLGASTLERDATRELVHEFLARTGATVPPPELPPAVPYQQAKVTLADPRDDLHGPERLRSEFFARSLTDATIASLLHLLAKPSTGTRRRLTFTAMGGAYNRIAADATAFAHRSERFLLEHVGPATDAWLDRSWTATSADGSGHVYPNFPDPTLPNWAAAYHGANHARLVAVKHAYDPDRLFDFPQAI